jgi:CheY-like chemotaxis protein/signal transduction histidine kinase
MMDTFSGDITYRIDRSCIVVSHDDATRRVLASGGEVVGLDIAALIAHDDADRVHRAYQRQIAAKIPSTYIEFVSAGGARIAQRSGLLVEHGDVVGLELLARDVAGERGNETLAATIGHDIRTPMNGILGPTALLAATELTGEQRAYLAMIAESAESLLSVLADRLEAPGIDVDVREMLDEVIATYRAHAAMKRVGLSAIVYRGVPDRFAVDATALREALRVLVAGALRRSDGGDVLLRARCEPGADASGAIRFEVVEDCSGFDAAVLARVFERIERPVRALGGAIGAGEGEGMATIWVTIPAGNESSSSIASEPVRVLVVEDNPINRMVTLGQLRHNGLAADVATDGWEALDALARARYDFVLMDCDLPALGGCEATELIRRFESPDEHVVIVALTSHVMDATRERCMRVGMDDFLSKPVSSEQLAEVVGRLPSMRRRGLSRVAAGASEPALDLRSLEHAGASATDTIEGTVSSYMHVGETLLSGLGGALERNEPEEARGIARRLAAASRSVGARRLVGLLRELDEWLPERRIEGARLLFRSIRRAFDASSAVLRRSMRIPLA